MFFVTVEAVAQYLQVDSFSRSRLQCGEWKTNYIARNAEKHYITFSPSFTFKVRLYESRLRNSNSHIRLTSGFHICHLDLFIKTRFEVF